MNKISKKLYKKLERLKDKGGRVDNSDAAHNAAASKFIFDNSYKNLILYEASPTNDLSGSFSELAFAFKAYVESGLPFNIILAEERSDLREIPLVIEYIDKFHPSNVSIKVATQDFIDTMAELLGGPNRDFFSGDDNSLCRVSDSENKYKGAICICRDDYQEAAEYFNQKFSTLRSF